MKMQQLNDEWCPYFEIYPQMHNVLAAQDSQYQSLHQLQIQHLRMIITQFDK